MAIRECTQQFYLKTRIQIRLLLLVLCTMGFFYGAMNSYGASERAMWVWSMGPKMIQETSGSERSDFFSFVAAPHGNPEAKIRTIFLFAKTNISDEECMSNDESCNLLYAARVREFLADAHSRGLEVHLLDGHPLWALSGKEREPADRLLTAVFNFNAQGTPEERFDGIQYDVEPYLLEEKHPYTWGKDTVTIWDQYLQNLNEWQSKVNGHNVAKNDDIRFGVAIPFWWEHETEPAVVDHQAVQDIVDYIAIMSYNTRMDDKGKPVILDLIKSEVDYANDPNNDGSDDDAMKNSVYAGVETIEINWKESISESFFKSLYPHSTSFFVKSNEEMEAVIHQINDDYKSESDPTRNFASFIGTAVHYYEDSANKETAYRALPSVNTNHAPVCFVNSPSGKEKLVKKKNEIIRYIAVDADNDPLKIRISVSNNGGLNWIPLPAIDATGDAMEENDGEYVLDTSAYSEGNRYRVRIEAEEVKATGLVGVDGSNHNFSIVTDKTDTTRPVPKGVIQTAPDVSHPTNRFWIQWSPFADDGGILGYFFSFFDPSMPEKAHFTRGLSGYLSSDQVGQVVVYVWAIDTSGNLSWAINRTIQLYADSDGDGQVDIEDLDRDGDGVSDDTEEQEKTNPNDALSYNSSRNLGLWTFDKNTLDNSVVNGPPMKATLGTPEYVPVTSDKLNQGLRLPATGINTELSFDTDITPAPIQALTVEMWIKPEVINGTSIIPLVFEGDLDQGLSLILKNNANKLTLRSYNSTSNSAGKFVSINTDNTVVFDGGWHHLAMSYNGHDQVLKLFVDGEVVAQTRNPKIPKMISHSKVLRFFDGSSDHDLDNGKDCDWGKSDDSCVRRDNSAQFENNLFSHTDANVRYAGLVDNLKVTLAAIPQQHLGYYRDQFLNFDSDGDEMNDNWEVHHFGHLLAEASNDSDGDGVSNLEEFENAWNPNDANSPVQTLFSISGTIDYVGYPPGPKVIQLFDNPTFSKDPLYSRAIDPHIYSFTIQSLSTGDYYVRAFVDRNEDGIFDPGESTTLFEINPIQVHTDVSDIYVLLGEPLAIVHVTPGGSNELGTDFVVVKETVHLKEGESLAFRVSPAGGTKSYKYIWILDEETIIGEEQSKFVYFPGFTSVDHPALNRNLTLKCIVSSGSGQLIAQVIWEQVHIEDVDLETTAPKIEIYPTLPKTKDTVTVTITEPSADADGDPILSYKILWNINGGDKVVSGDRLLPGDTKKGDDWYVRVRPITDPYENNEIGMSRSSSQRSTIENTIPVAHSHPTITVGENGKRTIFLEGEDPDVDDGIDELTFAIVTDPANGTLSMIDSDTGEVEYQPNPEFTGVDSFAFTVDDGSSVSEPTTVSVPVNDWKFRINVVNGHIDHLTIGQLENATDDIDDDIDLRLPPRFPEISFTGVYSTRHSEPLIWDFRRMSDYSIWILETSATKGGRDITLNWDKDGVPNKGLFLREIDEAGNYIDGINLDMAEEHELVVEEGTAKRFVLAYGKLGFEMELYSGWNLISVPIAPRGGSSECLYTISPGVIWAWSDNSYLESEAIVPTKGYWLFYDGDETTCKVVGDAVIHHQVALNDNWNLVGACKPPPYEPIPYNEVLSSIEDIALPIWGWEGSNYLESTELIPGFGYWVYSQKVGEDLNSITPIN